MTIFEWNSSGQIQRPDHQWSNRASTLWKVGAPQVCETSSKTIFRDKGGPFFYEARSQSEDRVNKAAVSPDNIEGNIVVNTQQGSSRSTNALFS